MDELSLDKISEVLNSPDLMKNIQSVLGQLNTSSEPADSTALVTENNSMGIGNIVEMLNNNGMLSSVMSFLSQNKTERIALLTALRPFLGDEKRAILDSVLQILKLANVLLATNILK